jgi:hypothetical protein
VVVVVREEKEIRGTLFRPVLGCRVLSSPFEDKCGGVPRSSAPDDFGRARVKSIQEREHDEIEKLLGFSGGRTGAWRTSLESCPPERQTAGQDALEQNQTSTQREMARK